MNGTIMATLAVLLTMSIITVPSTSYAEEDEHVEFAANVEFIKGHLMQAVANKQVNDLPLAKAHAAHPVAEVYMLIGPEVEEHDEELNSLLQTALDELPNKLEELSADEFEAKVGSIEEMLDSAVRTVIPQAKIDDHAFWIRVAIELLEIAEHEYEEAVTAGEIEEMVEYQDATGFVARANAIFSNIAMEIDAHEREEIEGFFADLTNAMNSTQEPEQVETIIGGIVHEFKEVAGIESEMTKQPSIANIKALLEVLIEEYEEGEYEEAGQFAIKAYLDNYEFLETAIEEKDPELMENTEIMLREELRQLIRDRAPVEDVKEKVEQINANLDKILAMGIGVAEEEEGDPRLAYVENIRMLVEKSVEEYEEGEYEEALSFAIKAYLDNYEFIEDDVETQDEELNEEVERLLRNELQAKIKDRAPAEEIKTLASEINAKLDAVEVVVPEFPLGLTIALASLVGVMVAMTRTRIFGLRH